MLNENEWTVLRIRHAYKQVKTDIIKEIYIHNSFIMRILQLGNSVWFRKLPHRNFWGPVKEKNTISMESCIYLCKENNC